VIASRGTDQKFETRWHFVLFGLSLLESGRIVDVANGGNVHDRVVTALWSRISMQFADENPQTWRKSTDLWDRERPCSISDPQQILPLLTFALETHAFGDLECRDDTPLDLLAGLSGSFARILHAGLTEVGNKPIALDGCRLKQCQQLSRVSLACCI
jgi:hypothetical protein